MWIADTVEMAVELSTSLQNIQRRFVRQESSGLASDNHLFAYFFENCSDISIGPYMHKWIDDLPTGQLSYFTSEEHFY